MKILIATGIYPPEIGGPATYAHVLGHKLAWPDTYISVVTFSTAPSSPDDSERIHYKVVRVVRGRNKIWNRVKFLWTVYKLLRKDRHDIIYTLDWFAVGFPVALVAKWHGIPYVVRVGGDYLWEQRYLESGQKPITLADFYKREIHRQWRYRVFFWLIRWVLSGAAHVVFNSDRQRELCEKHYGLANWKTSTIYNPVPGITVLHRDTLPERNDFVFWGRFIVMKNLDTLVRAFAKAKFPKEYTLTLIGDGPRKKEIVALVSELGIKDRVNIIDTMPRGEAWDRVKDSRALVVPSWTDISPNIVYEALAMGLPALVTKENYLSISNKLPETIDPNSVEDVVAKLEMLADDTKYRVFTEAFRAISFKNTWDDVLRQHEALFQQIAGENIYRRTQ